jgi:hypothetical protein
MEGNNFDKKEKEGIFIITFLPPAAPQKQKNIKCKLTGVSGI